MTSSFKHSLVLVLCGLATPFIASGQTVDLLAAGSDTWVEFDESRWQLENGELRGSSAIFDGEKTDPAASTFLVSNRTFTGDYILSMEVTFEQGRYLGVYLDFDPDSQSGMWLATGHALAADAPENEIERGYVKTIDDGFWVVRATGQLVVAQGERVKLGFSKRGDDYTLWNDGKLIAVYRREGGYADGRIQLRLTNAAVRIHKLEVRTRRNRQ